jgi:hypothetical protein
MGGKAGWTGFVNHTERGSAEMVCLKSVPRRGDEMGALQGN